jgi:hypothetical protein
MNLTDSDKKLLKNYSRALMALDIDYVASSYYYSYGYADNETGFEIMGDKRSLQSSIPLDEEMKNFADRLFEELDLTTYLDDESNWEEFRVGILPKQKLIVIEHFKTIMDVDYSESFKYYDDMDQDSKDGFNAMAEESGKSGDRVDFDGGGDSGAVHDYTEDDKKIDGRIEDLCYKMLNDKQSGWEIDEGSVGYFELNYKDKYIKLEFGLNYQKSLDPETIETISFN